jgi:hypothetical protein
MPWLLYARDGRTLALVVEKSGYRCFHSCEMKKYEVDDLGDFIHATDRQWLKRAIQPPSDVNPIESIPHRRAPRSA